MKEDLFQSFCNQLREELNEVTPPEEADAIVQDIQAHLIDLHHRFTTEGHPDDEATQLALASFGETQEVTKELQPKWWSWKVQKHERLLVASMVVWLLCFIALSYAPRFSYQFYPEFHLGAWLCKYGAAPFILLFSFRCRRILAPYLLAGAFTFTLMMCEHWLTRSVPYENGAFYRHQVEGSLKDNPETQKFFASNHEHIWIINSTQSSDYGPQTTFSRTQLSEVANQSVAANVPFTLRLTLKYLPRAMAWCVLPHLIGFAIGSLYRFLVNFLTKLLTREPNRHRRV